MANYQMTAKYTQFFKDYIEVLNSGNDIYEDFYNYVYEDLVTGNWNSTMVRSLTDMIVSKYMYYEVFTEYATDFMRIFYSIFNRYKDYYSELIIAYQTEINFLDGNSITRTFTPRAEYESSNYDLPRSSSDIDRPTSKSTNAGVDGVDTTVVKGGDVIDLKRRYMDLLRNVYDEFASKFQPLFIELFDWTFEEVY